MGRVAKIKESKKYFSSPKNAFHPYFYWPKCPSAYKLEVVDKTAEESYNFGEIVNNENT